MFASLAEAGNSCGGSSYINPLVLSFIKVEILRIDKNQWKKIRKEQAKEVKEELIMLKKN